MSAVDVHLATQSLSNGAARNICCPTRLAGPAQLSTTRRDVAAVNFLAWSFTTLALDSCFWREQCRSCGGDRSSLVLSIDRLNWCQNLCTHVIYCCVLKLVLFWFDCFSILPYWIVLELIDWRKPDMEGWRKHLFGCIKLKFAYLRWKKIDA